MAERDIQAAILATFGARPYLRLWRQSVGTALLGTGPARRMVSFGLPGMADLSGILRCGRRVEVEVKAPEGRVAPAQQRWADMVQAYGGVYTVARSTDDVDRMLRKHLLTCPTCAGAQPYRPPEA